MTFRATFCNPLSPDVIHLGDIDSDKIIEAFQKIPWNDFLRNMKNAAEAYYSPSLEIENKDNKHGIVVSAEGNPGNYEFYIFYKRPKLRTVKTSFGSREEMEDDYLTDVTGQTKQDVEECLNALIRNDIDFLENKIQ